MNELLIVFVKNPVLGKVKTRLAKDIGNGKALEVYRQLIGRTKTAATDTRADVMFYFSHDNEDSIWPESKSAIQQGENLGQRMRTAFEEGFEKGYDRICLIGSDLPDISAQLIDQAFQSLTFMDTVIGPSADGGYYLIGLKRLIPDLFESIEWSTNKVLEQTLEKLTKKKESYFLLETKNDIDTLEDLNRSNLNFTN